MEHLKTELTKQVLRQLTWNWFHVYSLLVDSSIVAGYVPRIAEPACKIDTCDKGLIIRRGQDG